MPQQCNALVVTTSSCTTFSGQLLSTMCLLQGGMAANAPPPKCKAPVQRRSQQVQAAADAVVAAQVNVQQV